MTLKPRIQSVILFAVGFALVSAAVNVSYTINNHSTWSEKVCPQ